jgi:predicted negative regulator of RcsB-dependent stress response
MANFFSASQEEQQEILLTFWDKFKYLIIIGLIAIILFISGRDYFVSSTNEEDLLKATLYQTYLESDGQNDGKILLESYPESIYSDFVRLNEAKKSFLNGNNEDAISLLKLVMTNNDTNKFNPIFASAQTRLAKIYLEDKNYASAIATLDNSEELTSTMLELKGDAENGLGEYQSARTSYMLALQNSTNQASRALINMKISDLEGENLE